MKDLIEALQIMMKYENPDYPVHCEHDYLYIDIQWKQISKEDKTRLKELGFFKDKEYDNGGIGSFKYGSC